MKLFRRRIRPPALASPAGPDGGALWDEIAAAPQYAGPYPPAGPAAAPSARDGYPTAAALDSAVRAAYPQMGYPGATDPAARGGDGVSPELRRMMADNLRRTLAYVPDPSQRQTMVEQYRAIGVDLGRDGDGASAGSNDRP